VQRVPQEAIEVKGQKGEEGFMNRIETIEGINGGVVPMSEKSKVYQCPQCGVSIFTQYEGNAIAILRSCEGPLGAHTL
jgi:hypothetical protein